MTGKTVAETFYPTDPHRENSPCHLRWRTASTFQRIERRHGSDRPPSIIGTIPASIQWRASKKTWSAPRHHWMGTSKWKKRNQLEKEIRTGYLVRRPCLLHDRHDDILQNTQMRYQPQRHIPKGRGNHETIWRKQLGRSWILMGLFIRKECVRDFGIRLALKRSYSYP